MVLEYYLYLYLFHFPITNIFRCYFFKFWTIKYVRIFVCDFMKIRIYLNICYEPYFNIGLSNFNKKKGNLDITCA